MIDEPRSLARAMAISALPNLRNPISIDSALPLASGWLRDAMELEGPTFGGVLEDAAEGTNCAESCFKATAILVDREPPTLIVYSAKLVPTFAWRMRNDGVWTCIASSIAVLVPRINAIQAEINPAMFDKEGSNHARTSSVLSFPASLAG